MKLALLGYGKMGRAIEKIAIERGHEIVLKIDVDNPGDLNADNLKKADAAIDFSIPAKAVDHITACFNADVPVVSGTTGWLENFDRITETCIKQDRSFFYASNFSLGVNIFFAVNKFLAGIMNRFNEYNASVKEIHHIHKLDSPSGTAITIAKDMIARINTLKKWELEKTSDPQSLRIIALRENEVPGTHIVSYDSFIDKIEISHIAKSREGFAVGAVLAAEFIKDKRGVFGMEDLLKLEL